MCFVAEILLMTLGYNHMLGKIGHKTAHWLSCKKCDSKGKVTMDLVDSIEAGKLTISELIDVLATDKNYLASTWISDTVNLRPYYKNLNFCSA